MVVLCLVFTSVIAGTVLEQAFFIISIVVSARRGEGRGLIYFFIHVGGNSAELFVEREKAGWLAPIASTYPLLRVVVSLSAVLSDLVIVVCTTCSHMLGLGGRLTNLGH